MRLCANTGSRLHLIRPLGFELEDRKLRRAGLDYREWASVAVHDSLQAFGACAHPRRLWAMSTHGQRRYTEVDYLPDDAFLFGPETRGLPEIILQDVGAPHVLRLPMVQASRSLNLSNAVAVIVYEAWRQQRFLGGR